MKDLELRMALSAMMAASLTLVVGCANDMETAPVGDDATSSAEGATTASSAPTGDSTSAGTGTSQILATGNGAPSGSHYSLNIIGVPRNKSADMTGNEGHRIFVSMSGRTKIELGEGDFQVLDANGTDGVARFQLPNPDPDGDGVTTYSVFARALGTPGGSSVTTTCATDPTTGEEVCSTEQLVLVRGTGRSSFSDVSRDLLFIYADIDGDGDEDRVSLFDDRLTDYFWQYDNNGLKLAQLRFYPVPSSAGL